MRIRDNRLWAVIIALAFVALWLAGVCVAYSAPAQEPMADPVPAGPSQGAQTVGIVGWCIIAVGFLGVALCAAWGSRSRRRRRRSARAYRSHVERRF